MRYKTVTLIVAWALASFGTVGSNACVAWAAEPATHSAEAGHPNELSNGYVTIHVGVELNAIETAAHEVARSVGELATSVNQLAASPSLSEEHKAQLVAVMGRLDKLSERVVTTFDRLPAAVEQSRQPLTEIASDLAGDLLVTVIAALAVALVVILVALWGVYAFVLGPSRNMVVESTSRLIGLVGSLEHAAELVAQTNTAQLELARVLEAQSATLQDDRAKRPTG